MAEYLTLLCQCHSRYTHPFTAEYLTLIYRAERQVKAAKKSSNACYGTDQNAPENTTNLRTLPPNRDPCYYVCHFKAIS